MPHTDLAYISATLKGAAQTMTPKARQHARECFEHWLVEWTRIRSNAPERVAVTVHEVVDEHMQHMLATSAHGPEVKCRKGCASCCHQIVDVFSHEAALLLMIAEHDGIEIDEARLMRQAKKDARSWRDLAPEDQRCIFLSDSRECRVYEHRPGACRKYAVMTDPDLCDMVKHPGGKVGIVFSVEAEIVNSAAMTAYGVGNMAAMLLKGKQAYEQFDKATSAELTTLMEEEKQ